MTTELYSKHWHHQTIWPQSYTPNPDITRQYYHKVILQTLTSPYNYDHRVIFQTLTLPGKMTSELYNKHNTLPDKMTSELYNKHNTLINKKTSKFYTKNKTLPDKMISKLYSKHKKLTDTELNRVEATRPSCSCRSVILQHHRGVLTRIILIGFPLAFNWQFNQTWW